MGLSQRSEWGIGKVTAVTMRAEIGCFERFARSKQLPRPSPTAGCTINGCAGGTIKSSRTRRTRRRSLASLRNEVCPESASCFSGDVARNPVMRNARIAAKPRTAGARLKVWAPSSCRQVESPYGQGFQGVLIGLSESEEFGSRSMAAVVGLGAWRGIFFGAYGGVCESV